MAKRRILLMTLFLLLSFCLAESKCIADTSGLFQQAQPHKKQAKYAEVEGIYRQVISNFGHCKPVYRMRTQIK